MVELPERAVEIEPVADDEDIGDLEADEVGLDRHLPAPLFAEEDERPHAGRSPLLHRRDDRLHRSAGVEDVVDDKNVLTGQIGEEIEMKAERAWLGRCAAVAAGPSHAHPNRSIEAADEIGDDHDAPGEDADDHQRGLAGLAADRGGQPIDTSGEIGSGKEDTHGDTHRHTGGEKADRDSSYRSEKAPRSPGGQGAGARLPTGTRGSNAPLRGSRCRSHRRRRLHTTAVRRSLIPPVTHMPITDRDPHWSMIDIAGHPCECFDPPGAAPGIAMIYLHGVRERTLQQSTGLREAIETAGLRALAPRTGRSWWLDRIIPEFDPHLTPERFVVGAVVAEVERRFGVKPPQIGLVGTSMGGQGALRLSYRHPTVFPVAAAIAPAIDYHTALRDLHKLPDGDLFANLYEIYGDVERARQDTAILHVHPLNWPRHQWFASDPEDWQWHDGADRLHGKLVALGIPHTAILDLQAGGHGPAYYDSVAPDAIRFMLAALEAEGRRLA